ncbi:cytochrome c oxidase subunit 3 [Wenyingzhuangia sp. 2_MG-2023]|uniref:cytochrome c oxidase subunit 3 n=1 Tax=Wenyingzhuangia sp. 2_MG-2023 TaxID=3062639 RepID=UPI0026E2C3D6|nr:cytochrome c oxidase subunit 3 [Wenyingzhuangia sp. 2_MG-2023]MDO6736233.1 cytochrome c oxidase subunit 3 [Wenyingzhuangia sp. 2_MG-2023]MDO6801463.1 cytochrome c oxidase subunit 3 [Wenyingzhuangia sp. 1_MG-2023]
MKATTADQVANVWEGGTTKPLGASYGKMMMWFFILSDALTFAGFLSAYGLTRFKFIDIWPIADEVFTHFPFIHGTYPMYYVALMTFILIFSSVTMVLAVDAGHQMKRNKVITYMFLTIIGGLIFVGSQAWEWKNFIKGEYGAVQLKDGKIIQFVDKEGKQIALEAFATPDNQLVEHTRNNGLWFSEGKTTYEYTTEGIVEAFKHNPSVGIRLEKINPETKQKIVIQDKAEALKFLEQSSRVVRGANLEVNEYGSSQFADFFFFITGFHGFHVCSGIAINIIIFVNVLLGTYEKRGHYEMVEKVGLYWHFVDLVWVFVFTFFYLV